jgi:dihydroorotate dehydrogenase
LHDRRRELADEHGRNVPMVVKIAPDLSEEEVDAIADTLPRHGINGVIATNTTLSRTAVAGLAHARQAGGLSGPPVHALSLAVIRRLRARLGEAIAIIGVGGIHSGADALEKIQAGADAVQLYTGLIYRGPILVSECVRALGAATKKAPER